MTMKKLLLTFLIFLISLTAFLDGLAQETSLNNYTGAWSNNGSWSGGWTDGSPAFTGLPETNGDITILGQISVGTTAANQNLTFAANKDSYDFTVNDTLIVYGNVDFANKAMNLVLGDGAVFIIFGNLDMNNKIDISSGGTLVVTETFSKSGSQGSFTGDGNVYAGGYSGDAQSTVDSDGDSSFTIDQLSDDGFTDIENFVDDVEAGGSDNPLPIELLFFEAQANSNVVLEWATATEINNDYFVIERSEDGEFFYEIGQVKGNGNTNDVISYSYEDKFVLASTEYYRLKQVDFDGRFEIFETQRVETSVISNVPTFSIYPTVVQNQSFQIKSNSPFELKELTVFNISGGTVRNLTNETLKQNQISQLVNASSLDKGIYFVKVISSSGNEFSSRIIIK
jgi:hypothetical protein